MITSSIQIIICEKLKTEMEHESGADNKRKLCTAENMFYNKITSSC